MRTRAALAALAAALMGVDTHGWVCDAAVSVEANVAAPVAPFQGVAVNACPTYPAESKRAGEPMPQDAPGHVQVKVNFQAAPAAPITVTFNYNSGTSQAVAQVNAEGVDWHDVGAFVPVSTQVEWTALLPGMTVACSPSCLVSTVEARVIQCDCREGEANDACDLAAAPQSDDESCKNCTAGFFQDEWAQPACEACPIGTKQPLPTQAACEPCGDGFYTDAPGQTTCKVCPAGQTNNTASDGCAACPAGTVALVAGSACERCEPGSFAESPISCIECAPGEATSEDGAQCVACGSGEFADPAKYGCQKCPAGSFKDSDSGLACEACPEGFFQDDEGKTECEACPIGTFAAGESNTDCTTCPAGEVAAEAASGSCVRCDPGYAPNRDKTACSLCPAGSVGDGSDECQFCKPGTYQIEDGEAACIDCPANTYQPLNGGRNCKPCEEGSGASPGATRCTNGFDGSPAAPLVRASLVALAALVPALVAT